MAPLVGKRVLRVDLNPFEDGRGGLSMDVSIILEGSLHLTFVVHETEFCEYGIDPCVRKIRAKR